MNARDKKDLSILLASFFFVLIIALGVAFFILRNPADLEYTSVINVTAEIFSMFLGFVIFICCVIDPLGEKSKTLNTFLLLVFTVGFGSFLDEIAWLVDGNPDLAFWNLLVNTLYYMITPTVTFLFWLYIIPFFNVEHRFLGLFKKLFLWGYIAAIAMRALSFFTGWYFKVDDKGVFSRGELFALSNVYIYLALIATLLIVFSSRVKLRSYQVVILIIYALFPAVVGSIGVFCYGISLEEPSIMVVCLLMYSILNVFRNRERVLAENELQLATRIQENIIPNIFPAYPDRKEFDLYASMTPAKEVGGDFYDFFLADQDHLVFTIADVSGKGIPAALFMMVTKTLVKNQALSDYSDVSEILCKVNDQLCEGNVAEMFSTAWLGVLTISTGELRYASAGHEYPALKRKNGKFELIKERHSPPLGTMEGLMFRERSVTLEPGDILYLYTDGVPEATDQELQAFGNERMLDALNMPIDGKIENLDANIRGAIDAFVGNAPQFDDITMFSLLYNGPSAAD